VLFVAFEFEVRNDPSISVQAVSHEHFWMSRHQPSAILSLFLLISFLVVMSSNQAGAFATDGNNNAAGMTDSGSSDGEVPLLKPPEPGEKLPTFRLGETIRLEEMGPIILNTDGTTRRIANWDNLSEQEKKTTWRRISARNEERRKHLLEKMAQEEGDKEEKDL
jgi:hypothetical protein